MTKKRQQSSASSAPSSVSWKNLYNSVREFIQTEPWELFENEDVFIVQSTVDNRLYLCCIMGNAGQEFGLNAFRGEQGMRNFDEMVRRDPDSPIRDSLKYGMDMLSFSLGGRDFLDRRDLAITKNLMLTFPGGKWPLFRNYRPHYYPWYLDDAQVRTLTECIEQAAFLVEEGEKVVESIRSAKGEMLVRSFEQGKWSTRFVKIAYSLREEIPQIQIDDVTLARLRALPSTGRPTEIDLRHIPGAIMNPEPPYFGVAAVQMDDRQIANSSEIYPPSEDLYQLVCNGIVKSFLERNAKPSKALLLADSTFGEVFVTLCKQAGIDYEMREELPGIDEFMDGMDEMLSRRK